VVNWVIVFIVAIGMERVMVCTSYLNEKS